MNDPKRDWYVWLSEDVNRTLLLVAVASCLGAASLALFFARQGGSPTRPQFVLIIAAMAVLFYVSLRSAGY